MDMLISEIAYALYKENWLLQISPADKLQALRNYLEDPDARDYGSFEEYYEENGFSGQIYACFAEFLLTVYQDKQFIEKLLDNRAWINEYRRDIRRYA